MHSLIEAGISAERESIYSVWKCIAVRLTRRHMSELISSITHVTWRNHL